MKTSRSTILVAAALVNRALAALVNRAADPPPDPASVARRVVHDAAGVHEGDLVVISGELRDMDLLTELALAARRSGADPLTLPYREADSPRFVTEVPAQYDSVPSAWGRLLAANETVLITVGEPDPAPMMALPPDRLAARATAGQADQAEILRRGVRQVWLGNGMYPNDAAARQLEIPRDQLADVFWKAIDVDYAALASDGASVAALLRSGKELRITNKNGTDVRMRIEARPVTVSDGAISAEDAAAGGAQAQTWLPAGEVTVVPVPGTAEGKVVIDRTLWLGTPITGWTLTIKGGKVVSMTATSGLEAVQRPYDAAPAACRSNVAMVDFGLNPNVPTTLRTWMPAGMVSIGWGDDSSFGGSNACPIFLAGFLPGSTVKVDKTVLVDQGKLVVPRAPR